jgi:hypothetical protein
MKTSSLVLDFYDDKSGEILKQACPTPDNLPEEIKIAHFLSPEERQILRDEAYALILHNDGQQLRKFACVDAGNTILSTLYFLETKDRLPEEAVKVAAQNLMSFNQDFGLPIPEKLASLMPVEPRSASREYIRREQSKDGRKVNRMVDLLTPAKIASGGQTIDERSTAVARKRDSRNQPYVGDEADWAQRTNLVSIRGGADSGRVIPTVNQMKTAGAKTAAGLIPGAVAGSLLAHATGRDPIRGAAVGTAAALGAHAIGAAARSGQHTADNEKELRRQFLAHRKEKKKESQSEKVAYDKPLAEKPKDGGTILTDEQRSVTPAERVTEFERMKKTSNLVDVSGATVRPNMKRKVAGITALEGKYSLDSYSDVQEAVAFFSENWPSFSPCERHKFAVKTASRADSLGIEVPELLSRYGSTEYSPDVEAHLANRRAVAPHFKDVWDDLQEKRAMIEPEQFAQLLHEADELIGLQYEYGGAVYDPYYATFGGQGSEKLAWAYETTDGSKITEQELRAIPSDELSKNFQPDFVEAFGHNPTLIFDSMPADTKQVLLRMAKP